MKFTLTVFLISLCFSLQGQSTDYAVTYSFKWIEDPITLKYSTPEDYLLFKIDDESKFMNSHAYNNDSIDFAFRESRGDQMNTQESVNLFYQTLSHKIRRHTSDLRIMKNYKNKDCTIILYGTFQRHYFVEPLKLEWEMLPGIETIANLPCSKARTTYGGREYIVWYSTQIPISDGPYIFHGLPGLIVKVEDSQKWYIFELKNYQIKPNNNYAVFPFIEMDFPTQIDRKTYVNRTRLEKEDPQLPAYFPNPTPEDLARLRERRKTRFDLLIEKE